MPTSPFKFLDSYTRDDRHIFFGRDREIEELYQRVFESKIMLVYGVSGTGKSSLINCGLANKFQETDWLPINIRRGGDIVKSFVLALEGAAITSLNIKNETPPEFKKAIQSLYLDHYKPVYFIFDQFEELFIFGNREERKAFGQIIKTLATSDLQCRFLFVLREEYLAGVTEFEKSIPDFLANRVRIEKMSQINARQAIEGPCNQFGISLEEGFSGELLENLYPNDAEVELTYLQVYLDKLFRMSASDKKGKSISFNKSLLKQTCNVTDILGSFLDEQISLLDDPDTSLAVLKSFVSVKGTKRQMSPEEIQEYAQTLGKPIEGNALQELIQTFIHLRILRDKDQNNRYELRHDALAEKIYEKITLVEKELLEIRQLIENAYHNWQKRGVLISADDLNYIAPFESRLYFSKELEGLVEKSKFSLVRSKRRRRNIAIAAGLAIILVLGVFTIWAMNERKKAVKEREIAEIQKENALIANEKAIKAEKEALQEKNRAIENENVSILAMKEAESAKVRALKSKEIADLNYLKARASSYSLLSQKVVKTDPTVALHLAEYALNLDPLNPDIIENLNRIYYDNNFYKIVSKPTGSNGTFAFSADGKYILTGSEDKNARLLDCQGNLMQLFKGHEGLISSVLFSPDGKYILTGSIDKTARLWDLQGNVLQVLEGHEDGVTSVATSPDGKFILTGSDDKTARLWDLQGNVLKVLMGHEGPVYSVSFSPDGNNILTQSTDKTARLWNLQGNVLQAFNGDESYFPVTFAPDSKSILTRSNFKTALLLDLQGNVKQVFIGHEALISSVAFSPDGKNILTGSWDKTARIWDLQGNVLKVLIGHEANINSASFSPSSKEILTSSWDKTIRLWDLKGDLIQEFKGHEGRIWYACFSPDGMHILSHSEDKTVRIWEVQRNVLQAFKGHEDVVSSVAFSPDSKRILTGSWDKVTRLWDLQGNLLQEFTRPFFTRVWHVAFSPDGNQILTCDYNARLWDLHGNIQIEFLGHEAQVCAAVFSRDGKYILTGAWDKTARLWDLQGNMLQMFTGHEDAVFSVAFSPDGKYILTGSWDKTARLWDTQGNELQVFRGHEDAVNSVIFSQDGKCVLTGSNDKTVRLWNMQGNVQKVFTGHEGGINSIEISPDGRSILTGSTDNSARLWDMQGNLLQVLNGHSCGVSSVFSPNGKSILTGSCDHTAKLWDYKQPYNAIAAENSYDKLSIYQQLEYKILEYKDVINSTDSGTLMECAKYFYSKAFLFSNPEMTKNYLYNAINLFNKLLAYNNNIINSLGLSDAYIALNKLNSNDKTIREKIINLHNELYLNKDSMDQTALFNYYIQNWMFLDSVDSKISFLQRMLDLGDKNINKGVKVISTTAFSMPAGTDIAEYFSGLSWELLLKKEFKFALQSVLLAIKANNKLELAYEHLPLAYILNNKYEEAEKVFNTWKDVQNKNYKDTYPLRFDYLYNISFLESKGITHPDFEKAKKLLNEK